MRASVRLLPFASVAVLSTLLACGGKAVGDGPPNPNPNSPGGPPGVVDVVPPGGDTPDAIGATTSSKVDVLFVVDDSASMADKSKMLAASAGRVVRAAASRGDVHVGVITSSLGSMGGDVCDGSPAKNGRAHLRTTGPGGAPVAGASSGVLALGVGGVEQLVTDAADLIAGVGEDGCGLEAQLESAYRFLVQPDPWAEVRLDGANQAELVGIDFDVLQQRAAFLRPDSLVVVVLLTDEDDSTPDPLSIGGQGWAFAARQFPGSTTFRADGKSTTAPKPTSICATNPGDASCTSCGFAATCNPSDPACSALRSDPSCQGNGGYLGPGEDSLNIRFHRMKERFGIDPQFPIARYVSGFSKAKVPDQATEHPFKARSGGAGRDIAGYAGTPKCTNPLFARDLPTGSGDEICNLPVGPRGKELVLFAVVGGVPESLVSGSTPAWSAILGADPQNFDFQGIDVHMVQATVPRPGLPGPLPYGDNGTDPVHGREWATGGEDLQYACTFELAAPRACSPASPSCDCAGATSPPLCSSTAAGTQVRGKAYPSLRPFMVARGLSDRAVLGSACASPAAGYAEVMDRVAQRMARQLP